MKTFTQYMQNESLFGNIFGKKETPQPTPGRQINNPSLLEPLSITHIKDNDNLIGSSPRIETKSYKERLMNGIKGNKPIELLKTINENTKKGIWYELIPFHKFGTLYKCSRSNTPAVMMFGHVLMYISQWHDNEGNIDINMTSMSSYSSGSGREYNGSRWLTNGGRADGRSGFLNNTIIYIDPKTHKCIDRQSFETYLHLNSDLNQMAYFVNFKKTLNPNERGDPRKYD